MKLKNLLLPCCLILFMTIAGYAQTNGRMASLSVKATATVTDNLQLLTIRDIDLINPGSEDNQITVSPITSSYAGLFKILGNPRARVRITFLQNEILEEQNGGNGMVRATYNISGAPIDTQFQSTLLTVGEANINLGDNGEFFIWLGAILDISKATPGTYLSEFLLELEYI